MPSKLEIVVLTVVLFLVSAKTVPTIDFCNGTATSERIDLQYLDTSVPTTCHCVVSHTNPDASKVYIVKSRIMKNSSDRNGGFYRLSFTPGGRNKTIVDESISQWKVIFNSSQTVQTNIYLDVSNSTKRPKELKIRLNSGLDRRTSTENLTIVCHHEEKHATTETTFLTTTLSPTPPRTPSSRTTLTSTTLDHLSNQTPTSTIDALVLPDTADKDSDSTIPIAGGVIGGLLCIAIAIVIIILVLRRRNRRQKEEAASSSHDNHYENHVTDAPSDQNYCTFERNNTNEGSEHCYSQLGLSTTESDKEPENSYNNVGQ